MLRLNRLAARLSCEQCGHRLGDPVPVAPAEEDMRTRLDALMERIRGSFKTQAQQRPIRERTWRDWSLLTEDSDLIDMTTIDIIAWLQARLDQPAQNRAGDSE